MQKDDFILAPIDRLTPSNQLRMLTGGACGLFNEVDSPTSTFGKENTTKNLVNLKTVMSSAE